MRRLFLSDVHLSPRYPERAQRLLTVLAREGRRADQLYILGDLFDYWIGPKHLRLPDYREALEGLKALTEGGVAAFLLAGNRDFYLSGFCAETGVRVVKDRVEHRLTIGGKAVYLCHGDYLEGREGPGYRTQEFIRGWFVENVFTLLPAGVARRLALFYRSISDSEFSNSRSVKVLVPFYRWFSGHRSRRSDNRDEVGRRLADKALCAKLAGGVDIIVAGHAHRADKHTRTVGGREKVVFTLGDWSEGNCYLIEDGGRWRLYKNDVVIAEA